VAAACRRSLARLRLDYLDLYLVHWPIDWRKGTAFCPGTTSMAQCWRAMEALVDQGLVRAIGVSNFDESQLRALVAGVHTRILPAVNQVELHPLNQQPALLAACREMGVVLTAWSPLGKGAAGILTHPTLMRVAAAHGAGWTAADVALRWNAQRGVVIIPKSTSTAHLARNLSAVDGSWRLTDTEMDAIAAADEGRRRVPDFIGVWPTTSRAAAVVFGRVLALLARAVFAVVPNTLDMQARQ